MTPRTPFNRNRPRWLVAVVVALLAALLVSTVAAAFAGSAGASTSGPVLARAAAQAGSASDGTRTLTVSQTGDLAPSGQSVRVSGSGYDANKGVYLALCVIPPPGVAPSPCGGGADREGDAGASAWISSNPPSYATGLSRPYGPGGTFDVTFHVNAMINPTVDCRMVQCAIVSRNDHTRGSDRSQDLIVPVTFASDAAPAPGGSVGVPAAPGGGRTTPTPPPTTAPVTTTTTSSTTTTTTTPPPPPATVSADGTSVTDGTRTVQASLVRGLDPAGDTVTISGAGFDPARGIYVSLCRAPTGGNKPEGCAAGDDRSVWLSSNPPEWGKDLAQPFGPDGSFEVDLSLVARVDAETDCTEVRCSIVVRSDDTAPDDRSLDMALPVSFGDDPEQPAPAVQDGVEDTQVAAEVAVSADRDNRSDGSAPIWLIAAIVAGLGIGGAAFIFRNRLFRNRLLPSRQRSDPR